LEIFKPLILLTRERLTGNFLPWMRYHLWRAKSMKKYYGIIRKCYPSNSTCSHKCALWEAIGELTTAVWNIKNQNCKYQL